ncbi:MAG TPA: hypothetical protein VEJ84_11775 [Acidimicrobiales bacterium]|nr:hypothetical protein [Acidimicrobiales bacterium]
MAQSVADTSPSGEAPSEPSDAKPPPRHPYWQQVHIEFVVAMVAVAAGLSVLGVIWLPQAGAYPSVPGDLTLSVYGTGLQGPVVETLEETHKGGTILQVAEDWSFGAAGIPNFDRDYWAVTVGNLGNGRVCQPHTSDPVFPAQAGVPDPVPTTQVIRPQPSTAAQGSLSGDIMSIGEPFGGFEFEGEGAGDYTSVTGHGPLLVWLCWPSGGLVSRAGAYFSAYLPPSVANALSAANYGVNNPVTPPGPAINNIARMMLTPDLDDTADFTIQAESAPTNTWFNGFPAWRWSPSTISSPIRVSIASTAESQHEVYYSFLSGIAFGIAGGAAVAIVQELLDPLSRRRDRRHAAGGQAEH